MSQEARGAWLGFVTNCSLTEFIASRRLGLWLIRPHVSTSASPPLGGIDMRILIVCAIVLTAAMGLGGCYAGNAGPIPALNGSRRHTASTEGGRYEQVTYR